MSQQYPPDQYPSNQYPSQYPPQFQSQQYQPPQQPYGPPPPRRRKSWAARHKVLTAFLALGGLVSVIGIAAAAASPSPPSSPSAAATGQAPASPAASAAPKAKATTAAARTIATFSGSGIENTPKFTVGATWKLKWTYDCASFGSSGNFIALEDGGSDFSGVAVNELGTGKSGSTMAYGDAGTHYLAVNSECSWTVRVVDEG